MMLSWLNKLAFRKAVPPQHAGTFAFVLKKAGMDAEELRAASPRFYASLDAQRLDLLKRVLPEEAAAHLEQAEKILRHEFNLLGSGEYVPRDPERDPRGEYSPIDWYLDPVRNLRFPRGIPVKEWKLYEMRPANADIKYPWELARCQHWPALGQAWLLSRDERFVHEIRHQLSDFREANPVGFGVNWTCTMDAAIRALNWVLAFDMITEAELDEEFRREMLEALFEHGQFIYANLENHYEVTSNHFLSNVVGLYYLAFHFRALDEGREWLGFCRDALEKEIMLQVLEDGADYESSVPYHRLVTELFLGAARLSRHFGEPLSEAFDRRLETMLDFLAGVLRPDGLMPQVGDADDGRLHILSGYGRWAPQDPRHLFGPGGHYFDRPEWRLLGGATGTWEALWWGYEADEDQLRECAASPGLPRDNFRLYPHAGLAVARENGNYLLVTNGIVGTKGFGNHKHNDQLSFEYFHQGVPLFVDPGSFVYTSDFAARNRYRSTKAHNTLCVNNIEQNEMNEEWIFRLFESAHAEHVRFRVTNDYVEYEGHHRGYNRLSQKLDHFRTLRLFRETGELEIVDRLEGDGDYDLLWQFQGSSNLQPTSTDVEKSVLVFSALGKDFLMTVPPNLRMELRDGVYSPSYGVEMPGISIVFSSAFKLNGKKEWIFRIGEA